MSSLSRSRGIRRIQSSKLYRLRSATVMPCVQHCTVFIPVGVGVYALGFMKLYKSFYIERWDFAVHLAERRRSLRRLQATSETTPPSNLKSLVCDGISRLGSAFAFEWNDAIEMWDVVCTGREGRGKKGNLNLREVSRDGTITHILSNDAKEGFFSQLNKAKCLAIAPQMSSMGKSISWTTHFRI